METIDVIQPTPMSTPGFAVSTRFRKSVEIIVILLLALANAGSAGWADPVKRWGGVQMFGLIATDTTPSEVVRPSPQIKPTKRVLVFNEFGSYVPGVALILSEIRSSLSKQSEYKVDLFDESLDTSLFPEETSQQEIRAWYISKYRDKKSDIIVALGPAPI